RRAAGALAEARLSLVPGDDVADGGMVVRVAAAGTDSERALRHGASFLLERARRRVQPIRRPCAWGARLAIARRLGPAKVDGAEGGVREPAVTGPPRPRPPGSAPPRPSTPSPLPPSPP